MLSLNSITPAFGQTESELVSIEEYTSSIKNAYQKYGIEFEVLDSSNYTPINREILESKIKEIEVFGEELVKTNEEIKFNYNYLLEQEQSAANVASDSTVTPYIIMPIDVPCTGVKTVKGGIPVIMNYVDISYGATATYDLNSEQFLSVKPGRWVATRSACLKGIEYYEQEWSIINGRANVMAYAEGDASFEWTDPIVNIPQQSTVPFMILHTFAY